MERLATGRNPISLVRQGVKREKAPDVLDAEELRKLLAELQNPARALVFLTAATVWGKVVKP
jgi:hypothetical protein